VTEREQTSEENRQRPQQKQIPTGFDLADAGLEVIERFFEALTEGDPGLPAEEGSGFGDVGAAAGGVVLREWLEDDLGAGAGDGKNLASALEDSPFLGIADVDGEMFV
jgi:hypothetical protein